MHSSAGRAAILASKSLSPDSKSSVFFRAGMTLCLARILSSEDVDIARTHEPKWLHLAFSLLQSMLGLSTSQSDVGGSHAPRRYAWLPNVSCLGGCSPECLGCWPLEPPAISIIFRNSSMVLLLCTRSFVQVVFCFPPDVWLLIACKLLALRWAFSLNL